MVCKAEAVSAVLQSPKLIREMSLQQAPVLSRALLDFLLK